MHFPLLALPTLLLSALAAPTPALNTTNLSGVVSELQSSVPSLPEKRQALDSTDLSAVDGVLAEIESATSSPPETSSLPDTSSLAEKRQAEPVVDLINSLLATISPIAGEIEDAIGSLGGSDPVAEPTDGVVDIEGLLTQIVIEVEGVVGNLTAAGTGDDDGLAGVLREVLSLLDEVEQEVEVALDIDGVDAIIGALNDDLDRLLSALEGEFAGLLDGLNDALSGSDLQALDVPALKSVL